MISRRALLFGGREEEGGALLEYVPLAAALVGVATVGGMGYLGRRSRRKLRNVGRKIG